MFLELFFIVLISENFSSYIEAGDESVNYAVLLYRGGAELKIRKYLIDNNFVETVVLLQRQNIIH